MCVLGEMCGKKGVGLKEDWLSRGNRVMRFVCQQKCAREFVIDCYGSYLCCDFSSGFLMSFAKL